jgi:hypothetical protein
MLKEASKPKAGMSLAVVDSIRLLIIAAGQIDQLQISTPEEWKNHVREMTDEDMRKRGHKDQQ